VTGGQGIHHVSSTNSQQEAVEHWEWGSWSKGIGKDGQHDHRTVESTRRPAIQHHAKDVYSCPQAVIAAVIDEISWLKPCAAGHAGWLQRHWLAAEE
jgi:hypothetical protein